MPDQIDQPVEKIQIRVLGPKEFPLLQAKIPGFLAKDLREIVARAQKLKPTITADDVVRSIWRLGTKSVETNLARGIPPTQENVMMKAPLDPDSDEAKKNDAGTSS